MPTYLIEGSGERLIVEGRTRLSARKTAVDRYRENMVLTLTTPIEAAIAASQGAVIVGHDVPLPGGEWVPTNVEEDND